MSQRGSVGRTRLAGPLATVEILTGGRWAGRLVRDVWGVWRWLVMDDDLYVVL